MRYPYDMWAHLIAIDNSFDLTSIPEARRVWHELWRAVFDMMSIQGSQIFLRAKIVHVTQTLISFFAIYLFSKVLIRNIYKKIDKLVVKYLSFWSTVIWFTIFATFSVYYHHTWIMWYSVSYQITLVLFWYITALTLIIILENPLWKTKLFYTLQIVIVSFFILRVHSMEYIYYILYLLLLTLLFPEKIFSLVKKYFYIFISVVVMVIYFAKNLQPEDSRLLAYLDFNQLGNLYTMIMKEGLRLIEGLNRADAAINELMYIILFTTLVMIFFLLYDRKRKRESFLSLRLYIFVVISSLFLLIPLFTISAGFASIVTKASVVNRFYYSSSLFILLPLTIYYFFYRYRSKINLFLLNLSFVVLLSMTLLYSKYISPTPNYYKNIASLKQSLLVDKVKFHLSSDDIDMIGKKLQEYKSINSVDSETLFYARADIAMVLKFIYNENVFWRGRREKSSIEKFQNYCETLNPQNVECIVFDTPINFKEYKPYH